MPLGTLIEAGTTADTSDPVTIASGSAALPALFVDEGALPINATAVIELVTPGEPTPIGVLTKADPAMAIDGPCDVQVRRRANDTAFGVMSQT